MSKKQAVNRVVLAAAINMLLGRNTLNKKADLGIEMLNVQTLQGVERERSAGINLQVFETCKQFIESASPKLKKADRSSYLNDAMTKEHASIVAELLGSGHVTLADLPIPVCTMVDGKESKPEQVKGSYYSFNPVPLDTAPSAEYIVKGYSYRNVVSWAVQVWTLSGTRAVLACENTGQLKKALQDAKAKEAEAAKTKAESEDTTDRAELNRMFAEILTRYDVEGQTLTTEQLLTFAEGIVPLVQALNLPAKAA